MTPFPLSPAAVHCLIEIGDYGRRTVPELCAELKVTPAQLAHTLDELASAGLIRKESRPAGQDGQDQEAVFFSLTTAGFTTLGEVNAHAQAQVTNALAAAPPGAGANITAAFQAYAAALEQSRPSSETLFTPAITPTATPEPPPAPTIAIVPGYRPGILARTLEMHMEYYYPRYEWGCQFEAGLSSSLGNFLTRLDKPVNQVWAAVLTTPGRDPQTPPVERVVGVVYVDGENSGVDGVARVRAFIVDESTRGLGVGKKLLGAAMAFVRQTGFRECHLSTLRSLTVARGLYEREGFKEAGEKWFEGFGKGVYQLAYVWRRSDEV
jgi:ribosomal protein S18 acetylase RimI-like enzyme